LSFSPHDISLARKEAVAGRGKENNEKGKEEKKKKKEKTRRRRRSTKLRRRDPRHFLLLGQEHGRAPSPIMVGKKRKKKLHQ
jgi:hypothetical protein